MVVAGKRLNSSSQNHNSWYSDYFFVQSRINHDIYTISFMLQLIILDTCAKTTGGLMNDKERHLRWMAMMWEHHQSITREEKRKEEVLEIFKTLNELAKQRVEVPYFPLWEDSVW
jgi:hypothetical protein